MKKIKSQLAEEKTQLLHQVCVEILHNLCLSLVTKALCSCFSPATPLFSFVQESASDRLTAICIPETHKANLHKCSAIMNVLKVLRMAWCLMLPSTGVEFAYSNYYSLIKIHFFLLLISTHIHTLVLDFFPFFFFNLLTCTARIHTSTMHTHRLTHALWRRVSPHLSARWQWRTFFTKHHREFRLSVGIH